MQNAGLFFFNVCIKNTREGFSPKRKEKNHIEMPLLQRASISFHGYPAGDDPNRFECKQISTERE